MSLPPLTFRIPGDPIAKGRPRLGTVRGQPRVFTPQTTRSYESHVCACAIAASAKAGRWRVGAGVALRVEIVAVFARPASLLRRKDPDVRIPRASLPDLDNVVKAVLDGMDKAGLWGNDSQVVEIVASKWHGAIIDRGQRMCEAPGVEVALSVVGP